MTCSFTADCDHFYLPRYPLEAVSLIERRDSIQTGWVTLDASTIMQMRESSGMIAFGGTLGSYFSTLRVTYTGGYWYDTTEDGSGTLPSGATKLPDDLKLAWYLQCRKVWQSIDKLGVKIMQGESGPGTVTDSLASLEIVPEVKGSWRLHALPNDLMQLVIVIPREAHALIKRFRDEQGMLRSLVPIMDEQNDWRW
jgi:hypothetical protein